VAPGLSCFYEASAKEFCEDLTGGIGHQGFRRGRSGILLRWGQARREPVSLRSTFQSALSRQLALRQYPGHEVVKSSAGTCA
jgi:hypothetical protein